MTVRIHLRLLATGIDVGVGGLLALALAPTPVGYYFASRAVVLLRIGEPDSWFHGPAAMVIGILGEFVFVIPLALALALVPEAIRGRGLGKLACALRITGAMPAARIRRYLIKASPLWLSVLALISGVWFVQQIAIAVELGLLLGWLVPAVTGTPSLHDRVAGTLLVRLPPRRRTL